MDADVASARAVILELDHALNLGEQRVVLAEADVQARAELAAALADENRPPVTRLPSNCLTPSRCEWLSRPLRELPCPFLCAMTKYLS